MDTIMSTNLNRYFPTVVSTVISSLILRVKYDYFSLYQKISPVFLASDIIAWSMGLNRESLEISHNLDLGPYVHKEPHLAQSGGSLYLIVPILPYGYTILGPTYKLMLKS